MKNEETTIPHTGPLETTALGIDERKQDESSDISLANSKDEYDHTGDQYERKCPIDSPHEVSPREHTESSLLPRAFNKVCVSVFGCIIAIVHHDKKFVLGVTTDAYMVSPCGTVEPTDTPPPDSIAISITILVIICSFKAVK